MPVDPVYHVTRTLPFKSFISSEDVKGAAVVSLTRWVSHSHTRLIYHELDVWMSLVVISDVLLNLQFCFVFFPPFEVRGQEQAAQLL